MGSKRPRVESEPWILDGVEVREIPEGDYYGFVYEIRSNTTGEFYIGKKAFHSYHTSWSRVLNPKTNRYNKVKNVTATESNWKDYFGSSVEIKNLVKERGKQDFTRMILRLCKTKKELTFREVEYQCKTDALENPKCINSNILGKFFRSDLV